MTPNLHGQHSVEPHELPCDTEQGTGNALPPEQRCATIARTTKETDISLSLNLDGTGITDIETGVGFLITCWMHLAGTVSLILWCMPRAIWM